MREKPTVTKMGGKIAEEEKTLCKLLDDFAATKDYKVLVHGGGCSAVKVAALLNIEGKMVNGHRTTDAETLRVVTMVCDESVNRNIVAGLQARGMNTLGLTGADVDMIRSMKHSVKEIDYGFVGDVKQVNGDFLGSLIRKGAVPAIILLTHDGEDYMLNMNANTAAGETVRALSGQSDVALAYRFEKKGVLYDKNDDEGMIPQITPKELKQYAIEGVIRRGMISKLENSFEALSAGVMEVVITLASAINSAEGTRIIK